MKKSPSPPELMLDRALHGNEKLWKVWWLFGVPVAWTTSALVIAAELSRDAGHSAWGDLLDLSRLAIYWLWLRVAWKCSRNVKDPRWAPLACAALSAGLVAHALI
jgi:hypothetical protein